jgi:hypothetical protein
VNALFIVLLQPNVKINLNLLKSLIDLPSECHLIKLIDYHAMESLTDSVRPRMPNIRLGVLNIPHRQIELKVLRVRPATILGAPVGEDANHGDVELV